MALDSARGIMNFEFWILNFELCTSCKLAPAGGRNNNRIQKRIIMSGIDILKIESFIDRLERFVKPNLPTEELISYVTAIVKDAKELISFGERRLALDILLENLIEEKIKIDKDTLSLLDGIDDDEICSSISYLYSLSES